MVAISADGVGVVTWGEAGHVFARKMFHDGRLQRAAGPHAAGLRGPRRDGLRPARRRRRGRLELRLGRLSPDVRRRRRRARSRAASAARRSTRRSRSTPATSRCAIRAIDLNGRGQGLATSAGASSGQPMTALIDKRDLFRPAGADPPPSAPPAVVAPAISENNLSIVAAVLGAAGAPPSVARAPVRRRRAGRGRGRCRARSSGPSTPARGFDAASDRSGGVDRRVGPGRARRAADRRRLLRSPAVALPRLHRRRAAVAASRRR